MNLKILEKQNRFTYLIVSAIALIVIKVILQQLLELFDPSLSTQGAQKESLFRDIVGAVILVPIVETILFFTLPYFLFRWLKVNQIYFIIVTTVTFAVFHNYSLAYIVFTMNSGFIYAMFYMFSETRKKHSGTFDVIFLHAMYNFYVVIIDHFLT